MTTTSVRHDAGSRLPDWGAESIVRPRSGPVLAVLIGSILVVAGLGAGLASPPVGVALGAVLLACLAGWVSTRGRATLRDAGARPLEAHEAPRFENLAAGLSADLETATPRLWLSDQEGPNAFVAWSRGPHVGVTRALLTDFTRTEVEAVVAHCLVRIVSGEAKATALATALGPLVPGGAWVGGALDVAAAALTRYPPALASAIEKSAPRTGRFAAMWFASTSSSHLPPADRSAALEDL